MLRHLVADSSPCSFSFLLSRSCPPGMSIALPMYTSYKLTTQYQVSLQERLARKFAYQTDRYAKIAKQIARKIKDICMPIYFLPFRLLLFFQVGLLIFRFLLLFCLQSLIFPRV